MKTLPFHDRKQNSHRAGRGPATHQRRKQKPEGKNSSFGKESGDRNLELARLTQITMQCRANPVDSTAEFPPVLASLLLQCLAYRGSSLRIKLAYITVIARRPLHQGDGPYNCAAEENQRPRQYPGKEMGEKAHPTSARSTAWFSADCDWYG